VNRIAAILIVLSFFALQADAKAAKHLETRTIKIFGFGALSGPVSSFGRNSRAALSAAATDINGKNGFRLHDGTLAKFEVSYSDDRCDPATAWRLVQQAAAEDYLVAVGPSCSSVAEPLFQALNPTIEGPFHGGLLPVFTDGATKAGLAKLSPWAFRNVPNETGMYEALWKWLTRTFPKVKTIYGGEEHDFAHSHSSWTNIIKPKAESAGFTVVGETGWSINDDDFSTVASKIIAAGADALVISGHSHTTCGVLEELAKRNFQPQLIVGLTSSASAETIKECGKYAEGLIIPTTFAPITPAAKRAASAVEAKNGVADLHSMAAWEILQILKGVIANSSIQARPETIQADREQIRERLSELKITKGLLGSIDRTADREALKPFVFLQVRNGEWRAVSPIQRISK
jgi:branched-chain amino acid transport system substrate-binding protein